MSPLELTEMLFKQGLPSALCVFLVWNNARLIDRVIDKLLGNGNSKKK